MKPDHGIKVTVAVGGVKKGDCPASLQRIGFAPILGLFHDRKRAPDMRLSMLLCLLAVLLAGAPAVQATMVYKVGDQTYSSRDQAMEAYRLQAEQAATEVEPVTPRVGGSLLLVLPPPPHLGDRPPGSDDKADAADALAQSMEIDRQAEAKAIRLARIFDSVTVVVSDNAEALPNDGYTYKLWVLAIEGERHHRRMVKLGTTRQIDLISARTSGNSPRMKSFTQAIAQAARVVNGDTPMPSAPAPQSSGSAFFVTSTGVALTNAHVVKDCKSLKILLPEGEVEANLLTSDAANDLALVKVPSRHGGSFASFRNGTPLRQGETVVAYGYPLAGALSSQGNLSIGIVSALAGMKDDARILQISAPVQPGNSGGPLLDESGHVVGIVSSKMNALNIAKETGDVPQNINFAIKATIATNFLEANGLAYEAGPSKAALHTADIGDRAKSFTYMLKCQH